MTCLQGYWLIASQALKDPNFAQACVLIIRHDAEGAMGLVLNRPTKVALAEAWEQVGQGTCGVDAILLQGGPCEGPLMALHEPYAQGVAGQEIIAGVVWTVDSEEIAQLVEGGASTAKYVVGYSGWASTQLEMELTEGSWLFTNATYDEIFGSHENLWPRLVKRVGRERILHNIPKHIIPPDAHAN